MDDNNFLFFVCSVATIMATLGAMIGSIAIFRLQNIDTEIDLLKGIVLDRAYGENGSSLRMYLDFDRYHHIRKIYDLITEAIVTLRSQAIESGAIKINPAFEEDLKNIEQNTLQALKVRRTNRINFTYSAVVILITLISVIEAHDIVQSGFVKAFSFFIFGLLAVGLLLFEKQLRNLMQ